MERALVVFEYSFVATVPYLVALAPDFAISHALIS